RARHANANCRRACFVTSFSEVLWTPATRSVRKVRGHFGKPGLVDAGQRLEFAQRLGLALGAAFDHIRRVAVGGLAGEPEANSVRIDEVDAVEARHLHNRTDVGDVVRLEPLVNLAEPIRRHHKRALLHRADGVAIGGWLLAFRDLEERDRAVAAHVEEIVADFSRRADYRDCPCRCPDPAAPAAHERAACGARACRTRSSSWCRRCRARGDATRASPPPPCPPAPSPTPPL